VVRFVENPRGGRKDAWVITAWQRSGHPIVVHCWERTHRTSTQLISKSTVCEVTVPMECTGSLVSTSSLSGDTKDMEAPIAAAGAADACYPSAVHTPAILLSGGPDQFFRVGLSHGGHHTCLGTTWRWWQQ
jgi:hypothetical protein